VPLFTIYAIDRADALEARLAARPAHLEHVRANPGVKLGGPFLNESGDPVGSMILLEAEDMAAVQAFCDADPYVKAGVFERVEVRPFRVTVGAL